MKTCLNEDLSRLNISIEKARNSEFYKEKFKHCPAQLSCLEDIEKFPFTYPAEVKDLKNFYKLLATDPSEIFHIHSSSNKGLWALSQNDYYRLTDTEFLNGVDTGQGICLSLIPHVGWVGMTPFFGLLEANTRFIFLPPSKIPDLFVSFLENLEIKVILGLPSTIIQLIFLIKAKGLNPKDFGLNYVLLAGETYSDFIAHYIQQELAVKITDLYGSADFHYIASGEPGRLKVAPDSFIEIIDGELVCTTYRKEAMPLVRYKTGDFIEVVDQKKDGTFYIKVKGREREKLSSGASPIFPSDIEQIISSIFNIPANYLIVKKESGLVLKVEGPVKFKTEISDALKERFNISCEVVMLNQGDLPRHKGKAQRVVSE